MKITRALSIAALAGLAATATAQDSTSLTGNGDAVSPFGTQSFRYVLDLSPLATSLNNDIQVGVLAKSSENDPADNFENALISAQGMSKLAAATQVTGSFPAWTAPGFGINPDSSINNAGTPVNVNTTLQQFTFGFNEFSGSYSGVIGGFAAFDEDDSTRLYVTRITAATANTTVGGVAYSGFGGYSIDVDGQLVVRADQNDATSGTAADLDGNNWFRIDLAARGSGLNVISDDIGGGSSVGVPFDAAATTRFLNDIPTTTTVYNPANIIPGSVIGTTDSFISGSNFLTQWVRGATSLTADSTHLTTSDHRGSVASYPGTLLDGPGVWTGAILARDNGGSATRAISVWNITTAGTVGDQFTAILPATITDNTTGRTLSGGEFDHYRSQTAFRGGVSQVALGQDSQGRALIAANVDDTASSSATDLLNTIVVGRFFDDGTGLQWTSVAYNSATGVDLGTPFQDAAGNDYIIVPPTSPFISSSRNLQVGITSPGMDSAGNVYFIAPFVDVIDGNPAVDESGRLGLFRGVYDDATFSYELELLLAEGDVIRGENSDTDFLIFQFETSDNNSVGSQSFWSNNVSAFPNGDADLGGLVVLADITYDLDDDGMFEIPGDDEAYAAVLFVSDFVEPNVGPTPCSGADLAMPFGVLNFADVQAFLGQFGQGLPGADLAAPMGVFNFADVQAFLGLFGQGCNS